MFTNAGEGQAPSRHQQAQTFTACYAVQAATDPSVMPRLANVFAKRGLTPSGWHLTAAGPNRAGRTAAMHVDIQMAGVDADLAERLAQDLRKVLLVETVLTSRKHTAVAG